LSQVRGGEVAKLVVLGIDDLRAELRQHELALGADTATLLDRYDDGLLPESDGVHAWLTCVDTLERLQGSLTPAR
jgi:hypothetical protein